MPAGVPVATFAVGVAGATNAALFAASILARTASADRRRAAARAPGADRRGAGQSRSTRGDRRRDDDAMTIGVVGAGQLGAMLALSGYPLGLDFLFLDRSAATPAGRFAPVLSGEFTDPALLRQLAERSEVITFDWENISVEALRAAARGTRARIAPPLRALAAAQDRLSEKRTFQRLRFPRLASGRWIPAPHWIAPSAASACRAYSRRAGWDTTARASSFCAPRIVSAPGSTRQRAADLRGIRAVRLRGIDHRCARPGR